MRKVDGDSVFIEVASTTVLYIDKTSTLNVYHGDYNTMDIDGFISLSELQKQVDSHYLRVIYDRGLDGDIYTYGNYRDNCWYHTGRTNGYA